MTQFPVEVWALLAVMGVLATLAVLLTLATSIRNQAFVHDTRVRVNTLKQRHARELAEARDAEVYADVIVLPDRPERAAA